MFRKRAHVSTKFTQMTYAQINQISSNLPRNSSKRTSSRTKFHPPYAWRSKKMQVIEHTVTSAKPWSAAGAFRTEEPLTLRPRLPFLPPKTYIPSATSLHTAVWPLRSCWRRSARGQLTPAIALAKVAEMF